MVHAAPDFSTFLQRREHLAQEARSARAVYAYGVDLRRTAWLDHSSVGEAVMRAVDRRWSGLLDALSAEVLQPADQSPSTTVMQQLVRLGDLLRAPRPAVRLLRGDVNAAEWPVATPLGTAQGGAHLLILDPRRFSELSGPELNFVLATALAHLQCDHGPMITAHLMVHRASRGSGLLRQALSPWTKVSTFSADRAALLVLGDLAAATEAVATVGTPNVPWWPRSPSLKLRVQALEDFDKSRVMARLRLLHQGHEASPTTAPHAAPQESPAEPLEPETDTTSRDPVEDAEREAERIEHARASDEASEEQRDEQRFVQEQLRKAWSLARCDQRLTRRLGLL